jgi:hypothetical protein
MGFGFAVVKSVPVSGCLYIFSWAAGADPVWAKRSGAAPQRMETRLVNIATVILRTQGACIVTKTPDAPAPPMLKLEVFNKD